jgi:hypothetical protein
MFQGGGGSPAALAYLSDEEFLAACQISGRRPNPEKDVTDDAIASRAEAI